MFEKKTDPLISGKAFQQRMVRHLFYALTVIVVSLMLGVFGYVFLEGMRWEQALLNAATLLSGLGLSQMPQEPGAQLFASAYALLCGFVFVAVSGIVIVPILHRMLHYFHWEE
ncbi:MAG TPA: hypothetical protein DCO82_13145 [Alphaproteobacteria bacterium]|jgi:hypothetical protein|nr:hypothetical protein [Alphaproteobacteria bacterium]